MKEFSAPSATILLLDSVPVMREALYDALRSEGYWVAMAGDLGEAVDRLDEIKPDLLIVRPYINSMSGRTAANYLRSRVHGLPVLILAGFLEDDRANAENAIEKFYTFPKAFTRDEFAARVRDILQSARAKRHAAPPHASRA